MASKFILIQLFLFSFSLLNFQIASAKQAKTINLSIDHIMKMKSVESLALSPDSKWIAYVVTRVDEEKDKKFSQIHITSIDGKSTLPMTAVYMNASDPQWR